MSTSVTNAFITQYNAEVSHVFQQEGSKLRSTVTPGVIRGASAVFPILGKAPVVKNRARHTALTNGNNAHTSVTATLDNYEAVEYIDSLDEFKTNIQLRSAYTSSIVNSLGRTQDAIVIDELNTNAGNTIAAATMDKGYLLKLRKLAGKKDWKLGNGNAFIAVNSDVYTQLMNIVELTSEDFADGTEFQNGRVTRVLGFDVIETTELDRLVTGTTTLANPCFAWSKTAVGLGVGRDIHTLIERRADLNAWQVLGEMSATAKVIQGDGVIKFTVNTAA